MIYCTSSGECSSSGGLVTGDILLTKNLPVYVNLKPDQPEVWETALYSLVKPRQLYKASQPDMEFLKLWVSKWILEVWEAWGHGLMVPVISHCDIYIYILYIVKWERQEENVVEWEYALCLVSHHLSSNGGCDRCERIYVYSHIRNKDDVICHKANRQTLFFASVIALATSLRKI